MCVFGFCQENFGRTQYCLIDDIFITGNSILTPFSGIAVMSDFIESEAEESEEEFEEKDLKPKKNQRFLEEDGKI